MKRFLLLLSLIPVFCYAGTGHVSANITAGILLNEDQIIYLSNIVITGAGTITILPSGERTNTGDVTFSDEYQAAGRFSLKGAISENYSVKLPESITITNGAYNITVNNFKTSLTNNIGMIGLDGKGSFSVGCTLNIPEGITSGNYTGTYEIIAGYE